MDKEPLTDLMKRYMIMKKYRVRNNQNKPSSVIKDIRCIESYLDWHDRSYSKKKINKLLPRINRPAGHKAYSQDQIERMFHTTTSLRNKAILLFYPACGGRRAFLCQLKIKHITPVEDCYALRIYAEDKEDETAEYISFVTPEAREIFDKYLQWRKERGEDITPDSYAFVNHQSRYLSKSSPISEYTCSSIIRKMVEDAKIERVKVAPNRYDISLIHGFRHFFSTALSKARVVYENKEIPVISRDDKEKMMGHRVTSDLNMRYYDEGDISELQKEYKKAIPYLIIQKHLRQEIKINELEKQNIENDEKQGIQQTQIKQLQEQIKEIKSKIREKKHRKKEI